MTLLPASQQADMACQHLLNFTTMNISLMYFYIYISNLLLLVGKVPYL